MDFPRNSGSMDVWILSTKFVIKRGCEFKLTKNRNTAFSVLEDISILRAGFTLFTLEIKFKLRSRLSHQPVLEDLLRPQLIRFHLN